MPVGIPTESPTIDPSGDANAVSRVVSRFWAERSGGRSVSVDDLLETAPGTRAYDVTRLTAIQLIASQAAVISGTHEVSNSERETIASSVGSTAASALAASGPVPQIEGYDLVACLGRGGMGAVFEGYQRSTGRRVAVKFMLDRIAADAGARKRFEREVEVVARLQHTGIVSVLDSGVRKGQYFFVMDFVPGRSLDAAMPPGKCDARPALELICELCDAIDYAHQRGVLHRDLKPSNIIIDKDGHPHLLDFGLAKVFDPATSDGGTHGVMGLTVSGPGQLLGTLAYMTPEQARGEHDQTSVRTDVYSIGAIAYELLTGALPCPMATSIPESLARIIDSPPAPPSSLRRGLARDLDAVLLKALEKIPERRYPTAGELAADLRRHLSGEPVLARRVGPVGKTWRWVGRNRAVSAVSAAAVLTLLVVSAVLVTRVLRERDLARDNFALLKSILENVDPDKSTGVVQLLDGAAKRLDEVPPESDIAQAEVREIIGKVYRIFGEYDKARANQVMALAIRERRASGDDPAVAETLHYLAATLWWEGKYTEAEGLYERSLAMRRRLHASAHEDVAMSLTHLAACRLRTGKPEGARDLYQQALDMRRVLARGTETVHVAQALNNLAKCSLDVGRYGEAEGLFRQALDMIRRLKGDSFSGTAAASQNLGDCLLRRAEASLLAGDRDGAIGIAGSAHEAFDRALQIRSTMFPNGHHLVAGTLVALARAELLAGDLARADELAHQSVEMFRKTRRLDHPEIGEALQVLGTVQLASASAEAVATLEQALAITKLAHPPSPIGLARLHVQLARALTHAGRFPDAQPPLVQAVASLRQLLGDHSSETRDAAALLATVYARNGDDAAAESIRAVATPSK